MDSLDQTHGEFYISLVMEWEPGFDLDMTCNAILDVTAEFVREMLVGKRLLEDLPELEAAIRARYFALTNKPLIACLKDAENRYRAAINGESL